jgi:hypothetical protein
MTFSTVRIFVLGTLLALGGWLATAAQAEQPPVVGSAQKLQPAAGARDGAKDRVLEVGAAVHRDEQLWTGKGGRLEIALADGSTVNLGENARMTLDDFVLPQDGNAALLIRSVSGALRFAGGAIDKAKPGAVKIVTPVATMVVRGTDFFAGPIDGAYGVFVFSGEVTVANSAGSVTLKDGEGTSMTTSSVAPAPVKRWPADKIARAAKLVGF